MKRRRVPGCLSMLMLVNIAVNAYALQETQQTVVYEVTYKAQQTTDAVSAPIYVAYTVVAPFETAYWLQRATSMKIDSTPLSITQTLLDARTHQALRYIMHRPANTNRPENVIDLPLSKIGKDEIFPVPMTTASAEKRDIQVAAGSYTAHKGKKELFSLWLHADVPVLGVVKAEAKDWVMELFRITDNAKDLLPQKPPKVGIVYLKK